MLIPIQCAKKMHAILENVYYNITLTLLNEVDIGHMGFDTLLSLLEMDS